jgi:hypothetical protein
MTPSQRSIAWLKANGFDLVQKVEHWQAHAKIHQDLWGGDILAISISPPMTVLVQVTSGAHGAERVKKLQTLESTQILKLAGWDVCVHAWRKLKKTKKWEPLITNL